MPEAQLPPDADAALRLALAIADRTPVNWKEVSRTPHSDLPPWCIPRLAQIERVITGHRALHTEAPGHDGGPAETLRTEARRTAGDLVQVEWGPLVVHEKVGHGSFGEVYRAWDPKLEREVALKLVPATTTTASTSGAFEEGRRLARVRHPNVVTVHGVEKVQGRVGIWMEYIKGPTLADEVARRGPFNPVEAAQIGVDVCGALSAVHDTGLLHRDVKAQNVMRDADGRVVLGDFGTGRELDERTPPTSQLAGTPLYLAPEVLAWEPATTASDQYSVGVLLYYLTTGHYPVHGDSLDAVRRAHAQQARVPLAERLPDGPPELVAAIERALDPEPGRRHETVAALAKALTGFVDSQTVARTVDLTPRQRVSGRWWFSGAAMLSLLAAAVGFQSTGDSMGDPTDPRVPTIRRISAGAIMSPLAPDARQFGCIDLQSRDLALCELFEDDYRQVRRITNRAASGDDAAYRWGAFSPDGLEVAFVAEQPLGRFDSPQEIRIVGIDGAGERVLSRDFEDVKTVWLHSWTDPDELLMHLLFPDASTELVFLSVDDGSLRSIRKAGADGFGSFGRSPDGQYLLYEPLAPGTLEREIALIDLDSGRETTLVSGPANDGGATWLPNGSGILFNSGRRGSMGLWRLDLQDGLPREDPALIRDLGQQVITPLGFGPDDSLYYSIDADPSDVFSAEPEPGPATPLAARRLPRGPRTASHSPVWSPDGRHLAYVSRRRSDDFVVVQETATRQERHFPLEPLDVFRLTPRWHPDGNALGLLVLSMVEYTEELRVLDPDTGEIIHELSLGSIEEHGEIWDYDWISQDTIVFLRRGRIVVLDVETGVEHPAYADNEASATSMALSPDRARMGLLIREDGIRSLAVMPALGGPLTVVHQVRSEWGLPMKLHDWSADALDLFFTRRDTPTFEFYPRVRLWRVALEGGAPTPLNVAAEGLDQVTAHPDGRQIGFKTGTGRRETWVMEGVLNGGIN